MATQRESTSNTWAVLDSSDRPFCAYDSIDGFDDQASASVPTEPQENGRLYSYDKVLQPSEISVTLLFNGDYANQQAAMSLLTRHLASTALFTVVTPVRVMTNMTVVGLSRRQESTNGVNLLTVDVSFQEVRVATVQTGTVQWMPRNPTSNDEVDVGKKSSFLRDLLV